MLGNLQLRFLLLIDLVFVEVLRGFPRWRNFGPIPLSLVKTLSFNIFGTVPGNLATGMGSSGVIMKFEKLKKYYGNLALSPPRVAFLSFSSIKFVFLK